MGESQGQGFQLSFNWFLRVAFQGSRVTSDGGLILVRELDERLGFSKLIAQHLTDSRGMNTKFALADLVRQSVYSRLAGYEDMNDAERGSQDPTFRLIGSEKIWERGAALTSRLQSFETELLTQDENLAGLAAINRELIAKAEAVDSPQRVVLDMDSTEIPVYGQPITRCCCSIARVTVWRPSCDPVTSTAPMTGKNSCYPRLSASNKWGRKLRVGPTPPSPSQRSMRLWRSGA